MSKTITIAILIGLILCALPAWSASIAKEYAAAQALIADGNLAGAAPHLQAIVASAAETGWDGLAEGELILVANAHKLLMAVAYRQALETADLGAEQAREAKHWHEAAVGLESVRVVGHGEEIDLPGLLVPGKINIVDFFSIYCGPCVSFGVWVEALAEARDDIVLIKVDVNRPGHRGIDWSSPTAKQFELRSIPRLEIYGPDGELQIETEEARPKVIEWIKAEGF